MTTLDLSNHDYDDAVERGVSVREMMTCLKREGVDRLILGCWDLEQTRQMLVIGRDVGLKIEDLYAFPYFGLPHQRHDMENAIRLSREEGGILTVWLDCEASEDGDGPQFDTEAPGLSPGFRISEVATQRAWLMGNNLHTGIYTGYYWWREKMADTTLFAEAGDPLWLAWYGRNDGNQPPIQDLVANDIAFGGWTHASVHQWNSTRVVCGRRRCHDYWFLDKENAPMTPDERLAFQNLRDQVSRLEAIVAGHGTFPVVARAGNLEALSWALGATSVQPGKLYELSGDTTVRFLYRQGNSAYLGLLRAQEAIAALAAELAAATVDGGTDIVLSDRVAKLALQYSALSEGISALDDALEAMKENP